MANIIGYWMRISCIHSSENFLCKVYVLLMKIYEAGQEPSLSLSWLTMKNRTGNNASRHPRDGNIFSLREWAKCDQNSGDKNDREEGLVAWDKTSASFWQADSQAFSTDQQLL